MKPKQKRTSPRRPVGRTRKPYRSPKLLAYGPVRALTDTMDFAGTVDGGNYGGTPLRT